MTDQQRTTAWFDQMQAALAEAEALMMNVAQSPHTTETHTYANPLAVVQAWVPVVARVFSDPDCQRCEHVPVLHDRKHASPRPFLMTADPPRLACLSCARRQPFTRSSNPLRHEDLCDRCQAPTERFTDITVNLGFLTLIVEVCSACRDEVAPKQ